MGAEPVEQFRVLFLDKRNGLIAEDVMGRGTVDHVPVYPREVLKRALSLNASAMILAHNHPAGGADPSNADIVITKQLQELCKGLGIALHDHVIVTRDRVVSMRTLKLF